MILFEISLKFREKSIAISYYQYEVIVIVEFLIEIMNQSMLDHQLKSSLGYYSSVYRKSPKMIELWIFKFMSECLTVNDIISNKDHFMVINYRN